MLSGPLNHVGAHLFQRLLKLLTHNRSSVEGEFKSYWATGAVWLWFIWSVALTECLLYFENARAPQVSLKDTTQIQPGCCWSVMCSLCVCWLVCFLQTGRDWRSCLKSSASSRALPVLIDIWLSLCRALITTSLAVGIEICPCFNNSEAAVFTAAAPVLSQLSLCSLSQMSFLLWLHPLCSLFMEQMQLHQCGGWKWTLFWNSVVLCWATVQYINCPLL